MKFNILRGSGIFGIWLLGASISCFVAQMVSNMNGLYNAALIFSIVGALTLILGVLCIMISSIRSRKDSGYSKGPNILGLILILLTLVADMVIILITYY